MAKILFIDSVHPLIREELIGLGFDCHFFPDYGREDFLSIAGQYDGVIIRSKIRIDKAFLDRAIRLKFIGRVGAGMENIDVGYAESKGIHCLNSPEGNRDAVGEHALGMLLSIMNHMNRADQQVRQGIWIREGNRGAEIKGKCVGIIGYGNMGSAFAQRLKGFEANVISYDKYKHNYSDGNTLETSMDEIFMQTDILSLHVPLTEETTHLVDDYFLQRFVKNIWLINTARGAVVRTSDLTKNLESGKVIGAALDVLEYEDVSFESLSTKMPDELNYLVNAENVVLTPHVAGWTQESNIKLAQVLIGKIRKIL
ncbi:MAG: NAD(P)-dependent oxidoreductase [Bacteroidales bacterium]|nr:NAD(P)-dependent oxidoreductase [Bacteroidales bacterium]